MRRFFCLFSIIILFFTFPFLLNGKDAASQSGTQVAPSVQSPVPELNLTDAEKKWLEAHPVLRVGVDPRWAPIEWRDANGRYQGLSVEYLRSVEKLLGVRLEIVQAEDWHQLIRMAQERKVDMFSCAKETDNRKKFLSFTAPYLNFPSVIFTTGKITFVQDLEQLNNKKVALIDQYPDQEHLKKNYPGISLVPVKYTEEGIEKLHRGEADAFIGNLLTTTRYLSNTGNADVHVAGKVNYDVSLSMAARNDWPELAPLLQKALEAIPSADKEAFLKKWTAVEYVSVGWESRVLKWTLAGLLVGFIFIVQLRILVSRRTADLRKEIDLRKKSEEALKISEEKFSKAFQVSPAIVTLSTQKGVYLDVNETFERRTGYRREDAIGHSHLELGVWDNPEDYANTRKKLDEHGYLRSEECHFRSKTGEKMAGLLSTERIEIGGQTYMLSVVIDVTDRQRLEEQLLQSQKMESVGRLAGGVAHDFNNILSIILGHSDLLLDELPPDSPLREDISEILAAAERAKSLTSQLLAFSRKQVLTTTTFNLDSAIQNVIKMVHRLLGEDIRLVVDCKPGNHLINGDFSQIEQVIVNLCVNARDAMPQGGELTIETDVLLLDENYTQTHPDISPGLHVALSISDDGCGMGEETRRRIFDPFFTTKEKGKGTGLGLAMVYGIIKQHNGSVFVYSEPGEGTTFKIFLPQIPNAETTEVPAPPQEFIQRGNGEAILVVEDDASVRKLTCQVLTHLGYRPHEAANPEDCKRILAKKDSFQLLLTDVIMPDANGPQIQELVKQFRPGIKTVFMSGYTEDVIGHHGVFEKNIHFISKPFNEIALSMKIREALNCEI